MIDQILCYVPSLYFGSISGLMKTQFSSTSYYNTARYCWKYIVVRNSANETISTGTSAHCFHYFSPSAPEQVCAWQCTLRKGNVMISCVLFSAGCTSTHGALDCVLWSKWIWLRRAQEMECPKYPEVEVDCFVNHWCCLWQRLADFCVERRTEFTLEARIQGILLKNTIKWMLHALISLFKYRDI